MPIVPHFPLGAAALPLLLLTAPMAHGAQGDLVDPHPTLTASLSAEQFTAQLNATEDGRQILALATGQAKGGALTWGVAIYHFEYRTVGGAGEPTTASAALMVPTGGPDPDARHAIVLYAHGSESLHTFNMADFNHPVDDTIPTVAAIFAGNGYVVVAPNFAGYDTSTLPYFPAFNAEQQSQDMIDALKASRTLLDQGGLEASPRCSGQLFIHGDSLGGYVAMATHRAMEAKGMTVTASAPSSGPYALGAVCDAIFAGQVDFGATGLAPMLTSSYLHSYKDEPRIGNIYPLTGTSWDAYEAAYAQGIDSLVPGPVDLATLIGNGQLPFALFNSTPPSAADLATGLAEAKVAPRDANGVTTALTTRLPGLTPPTGTPMDNLFALGFGTPNLMRNDYRTGYLADALLHPFGLAPDFHSARHPLRRAAAFNDLTGWLPAAPTQLSGGHNDPVVFYALNTGSVVAFWQTLPWVDPALARAPYDVDPGLDFGTLANVAGEAIGGDLAQGVTAVDPLASDLAEALRLALEPANFPGADDLQKGFLHALRKDLVSQLHGPALQGLLAQGGGSLQGLPQAVGGQVYGILLSDYHDLANQFCHAKAYRFFRECEAISR